MLLSGSRCRHAQQAGQNRSVQGTWQSSSGWAAAQERKKYLRLKQMKSKQGNCVTAAAVARGMGGKGIPKERLVLATDSEVKMTSERKE